MIVMLLSIITYAQEKNVSLNGYIKDAANGELLIGATVSVKGTSTGAVANNYGYYVLNLPPGTYDIIVQFLGYAPQEYSLEIKSNVKKDFELQMDGLGLEEVVVSSDREESKVKTAEISVERLSVDQIKKLPQLLGEVDVIRTIQLLPGVSTVGEGATGFNVRGGNIDQNSLRPIFNDPIGQIVDHSNIMRMAGDAAQFFEQFTISRRDASAF